MYDPYDHPNAYISFAICRKSCDVPGDRDPVVHAKTAVFGLMYWNAAHSPHPPMPDLPNLMGGLTIFDTGQKCVDDPSDLFVVATSVCERKWNKNPFSDYDDPQYEDPQYDEENALIFLKWLREYGDITKLKIRGEEYGDD